MYRSHKCNQLTIKDEGQEVVLSGWVHRRRDHGGVIFIDLRDRYGLTQIVSDPELFTEAHELMNEVRSEFVLKIKGKVRPRPEGQANASMETGEIEVLVMEAEILNRAVTPPFEIDQDKDVSEELRLKYRYLDLRKERLKNNIVLRHKVITEIRNYFSGEGFLEIETPILIKGTPEGSREYIVPSRIYPGNFFVLPQSPQQLKQLLMIAGYDKYFQIARCFRDEDQRGDRQPEFTQLDLEMSFVDKEDVMSVNETLLVQLVKKFLPERQLVSEKFPVLTYEEAMRIYGSDKPDIRFELKLSDVSEVAKGCEFGVFAGAVEKGGVVKSLRVPGGAQMTRREIDQLTDVAQRYGAKGLAYIVVEEGNLKSPIVKFFKEQELNKVLEITGAEVGDVIFFTADYPEIACESLGQVRLALGKSMGLIDENKLAFCWVIDFPMFEKDRDNNSLSAMHHPFTRPVDVEKLLNNPESAVAEAYDVVLNGVEIGGGSIRIHEEDLQKKVFDFLGITEADAERRFGHMLEAFKYGAPPHGGIAWGLDRLVMLFAGEPNIREVIAFPKDQKAKDLMLGAPSEASKDQLEELAIKLDL